MEHHVEKTKNYIDYTLWHDRFVTKSMEEKAEEYGTEEHQKK
jgi:hypothetical protein